MYDFDAQEFLDAGSVSATPRSGFLFGLPRYAAETRFRATRRMFRTTISLFCSLPIIDQLIFRAR